jgi:hypothetical protein
MQAFESFASYTKSLPFKILIVPNLIREVDLIVSMAMDARPVPDLEIVPQFFGDGNQLPM